LWGGATGNIFKYYSISDLIISGYRIDDGQEAVINPAYFKDKIVIIGGTAHGLGDFKPVAINSDEPYPGMEIHATVLSNLLKKHFIIPVNSLITILTILIVVLVTSLILIYSKKLIYSLPVFLLFFGVITYLNIFIYGRYGYYLDFIHVELSMIISLLVSSIILYINEGKQKNEIRKVFTRYMSPLVIEEILKNPDKIELGGSEIFATVFFSDIKDFTSISEKYSPSELVKYLNEYFHHLSSIILKHKAMLDKYIGDAIMAVFGAPIYQETHAIAACRASLEIQNSLEILEQKNISENKPVFVTRIGLNSGTMIVGNIGTANRLDYTAIGDAVNTASRLESLNKIYGTKIIISESTYDLVKEVFEVRELDLIAVKGKNIPIKIYELLGERGKVDKLKLQFRYEFEKGLKLYYDKKWQEALIIFKKLEENTSNLSAKLYINRCNEFILHPPDNDWKGVYVSKIK
jgi:adenylate cyclase